MKRVKTADLTGPALDWVVAKANGITPIGIKKKHSDGYFYTHTRGPQSLWSTAVSGHKAARWLMS